MIVEYSLDLTKQTFKDRDEILGVIELPVVALDRHLLNKIPQGKIIGNRFVSPNEPLEVIYDGTTNAWFKLPGTWPPSIDTLVHLSGQRKIHQDLEGEVLEVGCGTGMAGFYAANTPDVTRIHFRDIQPEAIQSVKRNKPYAKRDIQIETSVGDCYNGLGKFNTIIACAPPATPIKQGLEDKTSPLFAGTDFLKRIIEEAPNHLYPDGNLIISYSSLGEKEFRKALREVDPHLGWRTLTTRNVAYRTEFLTPEWTRWLEQNWGLLKEPIGKWEYQHTVIVREIIF